MWETKFDTHTKQQEQKGTRSFHFATSLERHLKLWRHIHEVPVHLTFRLATFVRAIREVCVLRLLLAILNYDANDAMAVGRLLQICDVVWHSPFFSHTVSSSWVKLSQTAKICLHFYPLTERLYTATA